MSTLHLGAGTENPPLTDGQARLYSMKFCPFAHRIRLILSLKKIPHDRVNIDIKNKPEWYFQIHPDGAVPAFIDTDGKVICDSTEIANYLDEKYPVPTLYNERTKNRDVELLNSYSKIIKIFSNCIHHKDDRKFDEIVTEISNLLVEFEEELKVRGTDFYGGNEPGMLDIMMWPWVERAKALPLIYKHPGNFKKENFPNVMKWIMKMKSLPFVEENACSYEEFARVIEIMKMGSVDFDNV